MDSNNELPYLLQLLDDTDETIYKNVSESILAIGYSAIPALTELEKSSKNTLLKTRCKHLSEKIHYLHFASELKTWAYLNNGYSWDFIYLITEFCNPNFDRQKAKETLSKYEEAFYHELQDIESPEKNAIALQNFIFNKLSFKFSNNPLDFSTLLLNSFLENKKGSSFLLCMLYNLLAEKRHLPIFTVAFPANLVLVYTKKDTPLNLSDIIFYINPSNGEIFTKAGIDLFLKRYNLENKIEYFLPCSTLEIATLYAFTLKEAYLSVGKEAKATELQHFADIIMSVLKEKNSKGDDNE